MANNLCHFELMTDDPARCQAFYAAVFEWQFDDQSMPGYTLVQTGNEPTGGIFPRPAETPGGCLNVYFHTDDIDETLDRVVRHGGSILVGKTPIPNVGHFAMFSDPEGIPIGIMQPSK